METESQHTSQGEQELYDSCSVLQATEAMRVYEQPVAMKQSPRASEEVVT